jgi:hypothetical protein
MSPGKAPIRTQWIFVAKDAAANWELRIGFNQIGRRSVLDIEVGESSVLDRQSRTKDVTRITAIDTGVSDCDPSSKRRTHPGTRAGP